MSQSPRLKLAYVMPSQAQKHVTVNEALRRLDILVQTAVLSQDVAVQPDDPEEGDAYILPEGASGPAWGTMAAGALAAFQDGAFAEIAPVRGHVAFVRDTARLQVFDGAAWVRPDAAALQVPVFGVNAEADAVNRLAVKSDAMLLSHDDVTPGSGDARQVVNKADLGRTAAVLFQSGFSGRAEIGLLGDDALSVKMSSDGAGFREILRIEAASGRVGIRRPAPADSLHVGGPTDPALRLQEDGADGYAEFSHRNQGQSVLGHVSATGQALIDLSPRPLDGTSSASFRFFRETNTTGGVLVDVHVGNGTFAVNHRLSGNNHSFVSMSRGMTRVGSADAPVCTLDVAGPVRVGSHAVSALPPASRGAGQIVFVPNEVGGPTLAFSDGAAWRRVHDRAVVG